MIWLVLDVNFNLCSLDVLDYQYLRQREFLGHFLSFDSLNCFCLTRFPAGRSWALGARIGYRVTLETHCTCIAVPDTFLGIQVENQVQFRENCHK